MIPCFAVIGIRSPRWHFPRLWVPLFLLWIPLLLVAPVIFLVLLVACAAGRSSAWRGAAVLWDILCSLPGTDVYVSAELNQVQVRIL